MLRVEGLEVRYGGVLALRGVSLDVRAGEAVALLGANGAGKSTLLKAVIGLLRPHAGEVLLDDRPLGRLRPERRARLGVGYCPEGRRPFAGLTVRENLLVACWAGAVERTRRIEEAFALFPALRDKAALPAWQLSGGQQGMLAIARSLMNRPRLLLLDEPSLGLSPRLVDEVFAAIWAIRAGGVAVLLAEQNARLALETCDRAWVLRTGEVVQHGPARELAASDAVRTAFLGE